MRTIPFWRKTAVFSESTHFSNQDGGYSNHQSCHFRQEASCRYCCRRSTRVWESQLVIWSKFEEVILLVWGAMHCICHNRLWWVRITWSLVSNKIPLLTESTGWCWTFPRISINGKHISTSPLEANWALWMQSTKLEVWLVSLLCRSLILPVHIKWFTYLVYRPYMADWWGRKVPIVVGCLLMVLGGFLGAFCNGYGSKLCQIGEWF